MCLPITRLVAFPILTVALGAVLLAATVAEAGWSTRKGGGLGTLVSTTTPAGDELFLFCSKTGLGVGLVARISTRPGGPSDLTQVPISIALDDKPGVALVVEGYDGAWVGTDPAAAAVVRDIAAATAVTVTIAPSHAAAFETARQIFAPGGGLAAALGKAGFPARCRTK
jgi:hypothetical protein